jgi:hypothetical protein
MCACRSDKSELNGATDCPFRTDQSGHAQGELEWHAGAACLDGALMPSLLPEWPIDCIELAPARPRTPGRVMNGLPRRRPIAPFVRRLRLSQILHRRRCRLPNCLRTRSAANDGGWGGIRTHEGCDPLPVFKTGAFNRSATHPHGEPLRCLASAPQHGGRSTPKQAVQLAEVSAEGFSGGRCKRQRPPQSCFAWRLPAGAQARRHRLGRGDAGLGGAVHGAVGAQRAGLAGEEQPLAERLR